MLLYELLTGTTPFDRQRLQQAAFDEIRRIIREEEPPRPSTRISTLGETRTAVDRRRQRKIDPRPAEPARCAANSDWIVMKCLEKDRTRRYETANGLAMDIQRHLDDEPVEARPQRSYTGCESSPSEIASCSPFCLRRRWWCSWAWLVWLSATS